MQIKYHKITIKSYLDFIQLIQDYKGSHKENRLFALKHESLLTNPKEILFLWFETHAFRRTNQATSEELLNSFGTINSLLGILSLIFGFFVGMGLLSYNGVEPVNIIYYLFFAMFLPLGSMLLTLFSSFSSGKLFSFFSIFSVMHWIEKFSFYFYFKDKLDLLTKNIPFKLQKWIFLKRLQFLSLLFSIGLLVALIFTVVSQDIAFSWSTTLQIDAKSFHSFLEAMATPWRELFPTFVPSLELVEVSHYYRLGEKINPEMLENAEKLGAWWKFLFMSTFVYALGLRFFFYLFSSYSYQKVLENEFFDLGGIKRLLKEFNKSFIETRSPKRENHLKIKKEHKQQVRKKFEKKVEKQIQKEVEKKVETHLEKQVEKRVDKEVIKKVETHFEKQVEQKLKEKVEQQPEKQVEIFVDKEPKEELIIEEIEYIEEFEEDYYHSIIAWNFSEDDLLLVNDFKNITASFISSVGGSHTFEEDEFVANRAEDKVLLYVKSWEPPTMDFVDFLEELIDNENVEEIEILLVGISDNNYKSLEKEFSIWNRKIEGLNANKVWIIDAK